MERVKCVLMERVYHRVRVMMVNFQSTLMDVAHISLPLAAEAPSS